MWVAIEATTLATAPLLYFNHNPRSLEATWKYLLIGSVGIALALLGSFFLGLLGAARRASTPSLLLRRPDRATRRSCRRRGCTPRSCCCSSATAPRWAWRRCTPGSRTPTARRRALVGALLAGGAHELRLPRASCASTRSARRPARPRSPASSCSSFGLLSMAVAAVFMVAAARLQAHARLLQRRAHGHPGARRRHRRRAARSARCCT